MALRPNGRTALDTGIVDAVFARDEFCGRFGSVAPDADTGPIFHICRRDDWSAAERVGAYHGSAQDKADEFIHFSDAARIVESAARHRAGQQGLVLVAVDPKRLGDALRWEESRGGVLFPHLYGALRMDAVIAVHDLPLGPDGRHVFPALG